MRIRYLGPILFVLYLIGLPAWVFGQLVENFQPPRVKENLQRSAQRVADQLQDWARLGWHYQENLELETQPPEPGRVVFFGDSITARWDLKRDFAGRPYVNRGVGGQTTPQMLVRTFPDVIDLHPAAVILLAGTNDIAANTGPETLRMIEENIQAITELTRNHGIKVVLCSVLPVSDYTAEKRTTQRPPADILRLNAWLRGYAHEAQIEYADYFSALVDAKGMMKQGLSDEGLHPNVNGYALMAPIAQVAIERALR